MKDNKKYRLLYLAILLCGIVAAGGILAGRARVEDRNRTWDIVLDYTDVAKAADQAGEPVEDWLRAFAENGVRRVGVYEAELSDLYGDASFRVTGEKPTTIRSEPDWRSRYPEEVAQWIDAASDKYDMLLSFEDPELWAWVLEALAERAPELEFRSFRDEDLCWLYLDGTYALSAADWMELPLGILPRTAALMEECGLEIVPRWNTVDGTNSATLARAVLADCEAFGSPYLLNGGDGFLGFDEAAGSRSLVTEWLSRTGTALAVTEDMDQSMNVVWPGFDAMVTEDLSSSVVRVFNEFGFIQARWQYYGYAGSEEVVNSLFRAVVERNCRIVYLRCMMKTDSTTEYVADLSAHMTMLSSLISRMEEAGYTLGTASAMEAYQAPWYLRLITALGLVAGVVLLADLCVSSRLLRVLLAAVGTLGVCLAFYAAPNTVKLLGSMGAAVLFPCLAGMLLYRFLALVRSRPVSGVRLIARSAGAALLCALICLVGAMTAASALSETAYMTEMRLYRGVKLMQLLPIAFLACMFLWTFTLPDLGLRQGLTDWARDTLRGLVSPAQRSVNRQKRRERMARTVTVGNAVAVGVILLLIVGVGGVGIYYLARTGNTTTATEVSSLEMRLRNLLENVLIARPRTKEFLIGWPCLMLLVYALHRRSRVIAFVCSLGTTIGLTSVINTFQHIRTPLALSLQRTAYGLILGLLIGTVLLLAVELLRRVLRWGGDADA